MEFSKIKQAVAKRFKELSKHELFRTSVEKDELWATYLASFPAGTNPIYRERTEHDCSCCRQFIRSVGNVVAVINGQIETVWDCQIPGELAYQAVADAMAALVKSKPIACQFLFTERTAGVDKNFEELFDGVKTWEHFFVNIPMQFVKPGVMIGTLLSESNSAHDVFLRSLIEITLESADIVLELIGQQSLYRGEEHKFAVDSFRKLKTKFDQLLTDAEKDIFVWSNLKSASAAVARMRNTAIGTLLVDLSEGMDLESAVKSFESKVAPTNYRRPIALVTQTMVKQAKEKLQELGLISALERRYATLADIKVNELLFVDRQAKKIIDGDVFDELMAGDGAKKRQRLDKVEEIPIEKFISDIMPHADEIEILFEGRHTGNLMSLVAPADPTAPGLFKWDNPFSWTYNGEVADSIKEKVKKAGGSVEGDLCCRLAWFNYDDLDFHMIEPNKYEIYYVNRGHISPCGGELDVDMNAGCGRTREPVENIFYRSSSKMKDGIYTLNVHNYCKRELTDIGFEVEVDIMGTVYRFSYPQAVASTRTITVAEIKYSKKDGFEIVKSLPWAQGAKEIWGIKTNNFQRVSTVMLSPNHWNGRPVGNKHYFFIMDGCVNPGPARGFYNEFLKEQLNAHRKVFEVVGSKIQLPESKEQVSGLGFSSTQKNKLTCRVKGNFTRIVNIIF